MGIVSRILRPQAMNSYELEKLIFSTFGGGTTSSGVSVNSDSAMRQMTVYACVKILSQSIAQLPLHLIAQNGEIKKKAVDHPLYRRLHDQPNRWMTAPEFWLMTVAHVSLLGDFLAFKSQLGGGQIQELLPIHPSRVHEIKQNEDWSLTYKIGQADRGEGMRKEGLGRAYRDYSQNEIFHIRGLSTNGYSGLNPIAYARESIGLGLASEKFLSRFFGNGMHPGAVVKHPLTLNAPAHASLRTALKEKYAGIGKTHDLMLIDEGMDITFPPIKLVDAQFLELGKFTQSQIAGLFRVPLMLLQAGDNPTTFASAEQFMLAFVTHALTPIIVSIEQAIKRDLLTEEEKQKYYPKFSMAGLLRGDMKSRFEAYATAIDKEIMNPNEVRDLEDMNPYPGGEEYRTRTSSMKETGKATAEGDKK